MITQIFLPEKISTKKKFIINFSAQLFSYIVSLIISFLSVSYAARRLGADGFGLYNLLFSFLNYALIFSSFGFTSFANRELPRLENISELVNFTVSLRFLLSLVFSIGMFFFIINVFPGPQVLSLAFILLLNVIINSLDLRWVFINREMTWKSAYMGVVGQSFCLLLIILFVHNQGDIAKYALAQLAVIFFPAIISTTLYINNFQGIHFTLKINNYRHLIKESIPLGFSALTATINSTYSGIFIGLVLNAHLLGQYFAGLKMILLINAFYFTLATVIVPKISKFFVHNKEALIRTLRVYFALCISAGICGGLLLFLLSGTLVQYIFGAEYSDTRYLIKLWAVTYVPLNSLTVFVLSTLIPCNASKIYLYTLLGGAATLVLTVPVFAMFFDITGVILAQGVSEIVMITIGGYAIIKRIPLNKKTLLSFINPLILMQEITSKSKNI